VGTSIRSVVVAAIETDDFGPSGGAAYARGHVRAIARYLELDSVSLVAAFDGQVAHVAPPPIAHSLVGSSATEVELTRPTRVRWGRLLAVAVLFLGVAVAAAIVAHSLVKRH
jgi:cytoskeletal protein RodZ